MPPNQRISDVLEQILLSDVFTRSKNLTKLLSYVVTEDMAGRGEQLSGKSIARQALGRSTTQQDSLVRVEIARLRQALHNYNNDNPHLPLHITIPKGRYQPRYTVPDRALSRAHKRREITLMFLPVLQPLQEFANQSLMFSMQLRRALAQFGELSVVDGSGLAQQPANELYQQAIDEFECDYLLQGAATQTALILELIDLGSRAVIWTDTFSLSGSLEDQNMLHVNVTTAIAQRLLSTHGPLLQGVFALASKRLPDSWSALECMVIWQRYRVREMGPDLHAQLLKRLQVLTVEEPDFAMGWSMLAYLIMETYVYRSGNDAQKSTIMKQARSFASRGLLLDDTSANAHYIAAACAYYDDDLASFNQHIHKAVELAPNNTDILHHAGTLVYLSGDRQTGTRWVEQAQMSHHPALVYKFFLAIKALVEDHHDNDVSTLMAVHDQGGWYLGSLIRALVHFEQGDWQGAGNLLNQARAANPGMVGTELNEVDKLVKDPALRIILSQKLAALCESIDRQNIRIIG